VKNYIGEIIMIKPKMFRKRFIPDEIKDLKKDDVVYRDENLIITKWNPINPRNDFLRGISYTFLKKGYKISRLYDENDNLLYFYCDIIDVNYNEEKDEYIFTDLLADVKIYPDGKVEVLDIREIADCLLDGIIDNKIVADALIKLDNLLNMIYEGDFPPDICDDKKYW
jgi:predicted RNA-binding protein associated with RNAse of E/G family